MNVYKVELMIIDHDGIGEESIKQVLENVKYPNWCISPNVMAIESRDIGEWHDGHILNKTRLREDEYKRIFSASIRID